MPSAASTTSSSWAPAHIRPDVHPAGLPVVSNGLNLAGIEPSGPQPGQRPGRVHNTKLRVLNRIAYGFREPEHLIVLALLDRGGYRRPLPGRSAA